MSIISKRTNCHMSYVRVNSCESSSPRLLFRYRITITDFWTFYLSNFMERYFYLSNFSLGYFYLTSFLERMD